MGDKISNSDHDDLRRMIQARERALMAELADVRQDMEKLDDYQQLWHKWAGPDTEQLLVPTPNGKHHGHLRVDDIAHCGTQLDALKEIARLSGGLVNPSEAGRLVMEAGLSQAEKVNSVVSTLSGYVRDEATWEWSGKGIYRLKEFAGSADAKKYFDTQPHPLGEEQPCVRNSQAE